MFVKIGNKRLNLDQITHIQEFPQYPSVLVYLAASEAKRDYNSDERWQEQTTISFSDDDAKRLLLILDYYDATPQPDDYHISYAKREQALVALDALDNPLSEAEVEKDAEQEAAWETHMDEQARLHEEQLDAEEAAREAADDPIDIPF